MYNKIISCFLIVLIFLLQVGCATFDQIPKEELTRYYTDNGRYPSLIIKSSDITYKIPHDTYYINADTVYLETKDEAIHRVKVHPLKDKIAIQDITSVEVAATNPFLGLYIWIVGFAALTTAVWLIVAGVLSLSK